MPRASFGHRRLFFSWTAVSMIWLGCISNAQAGISILRESIIAYNRTTYQESLSDGSYKGTAGILNINPEVARSLGLSALVTEEYLEAKDLAARADSLFTQALSALTANSLEPEEEMVMRSGEAALASREARDAARRLFAAYRAKITPEADERLNDSVCLKIMTSLLEEDLKRASRDLREGLGLYYNQCQGLPEDTPALTPENVKFVNYVFSEFQHKGTEAERGAFDLNRQDPARDFTHGPLWKSAIRGEAAHLVPLLEGFLENNRLTGYPVDPLLFLALMRRESNFDPRAVSYVGAAGLTQIMPETGINLGMKEIYQPPYLEEAVDLLRRERDLKQKAISILANTTRENPVEQATRARRVMEESQSCGRKRSQLFARYRRELLENGRDDRLNPEKAIAYGYRYFSDLMKVQKGDISLALASYNAGPHRVKQYNGLPPYAETVTFRNTVLKYYREYLERLKP